RDAAGHGHAVLVVPQGRMQGHAAREVAMPKLAGSWQPLLAAIVCGLGLESDVETILYAPEDARIVVHRKTARVWIDGTRCDSLDEDHVRLLEILIMRAGQLVHTKDIANHVARGRPTGDTTRRVIRSFLLAVEKSFKTERKPSPKDLAKLIAMP